VIVLQNLEAVQLVPQPLFEATRPGVGAFQNVLRYRLDLVHHALELDQHHRTAARLTGVVPQPRGPAFQVDRVLASSSLRFAAGEERHGRAE